MKVGVFCSSRSHINPIYFSEMTLFVKALVKQGHKIVYGGSREGLMEHLADTALEAGGHVIGVIPKYFLQHDHLAHKKLSQLLVEKNLRERKHQLITLSSVLIAFPGGIGTLDEVMEVITLKQLGESPQRPLLLFNILNYWTPFIDFFKQMKEQNTINLDLKDCFSVAQNLPEVLKWIADHSENPPGQVDEH